MAEKGGNSTFIKRISVWILVYMLSFHVMMGYCGVTVFMEGSSGKYTQYVLKDLLLIYLNLHLSITYLFRCNKERVVGIIHVLGDY